MKPNAAIRPGFAIYQGEPEVVPAADLRPDLPKLVEKVLISFFMRRDAEPFANAVNLHYRNRDVAVDSHQYFHSR